jgi:hypothetical protein
VATSGSRPNTLAETAKKEFYCSVQPDLPHALQYIFMRQDAPKKQKNYSEAD